MMGSGIGGGRGYRRQDARRRESALSESGDAVSSGGFTRSLGKAKNAVILR